MKKLIGKIREKTEGGLRGMCGRINPDNRVVLIIVLFILFAVFNFYITLRGIYSIGRDRTPEVKVELPPTDDADAGDGEKSDLQLEIEQFFNENFKSAEDDGQ